MPNQQAETRTRTRHIPGLDSEVAPLLGLGLGITGLVLGLRPRLAPFPLALTALAALLYRDPERETIDDPSTLFAAADGTVVQIDEIYEHRFLHTDAVRITTILSLFDVPVNRSPTAGMVRYLEHVPGDYNLPWKLDTIEHSARTYLGLTTSWGPLLITQVTNPLARRIVSHVQPGDMIEAGERISTARFSSRTDIIAQRDSLDVLVRTGQKLTAGITPLARVVPL